MLVFYSYFLCYFLFLSYQIGGACATCCDDNRDDGIVITSGGDNRSNISNTTSASNSNLTSTGLSIVNNTFPLTLLRRSNGEARWIFSWFLIPYYGPYYEFYVNEYSYKFWAAFQMATVVILLYSAFAAIYFAKYTFLTQVDNIKEDDLLFWWRSFQTRKFDGLDASTFQRIMDAINPSKHY